MASIFRRGKTWWIAYLVSGRKTQHSLKTTDERVAKYRKSEIEKALAERRTPPQLRSRLLKDAAEEYLASCQPRQTRRSFVTTKGRLLHLVNALPARYLDEVSAAQIQDYLDRRVQGKEISRKTANHIRTAIMAFFNHCLKHDYISRNPVLAVQRFKLPKIPGRYLLREEIERLLEAAKTHYKGRYHPMVATAIYAGLRLGELFALEWDDVDLERKTITVKDKPRLGLRTKDADFRVIPIHSRLLAILGLLRKPSGFCFFPAKQVRHTTSDFNRHFKEVLRKAGLSPQDINWLVLRRTFGSHSVQGGIDLSRVQDWMGHSDPRITREHYAHLQKGYDPAIERFGASSAG